VNNTLHTPGPWELKYEKTGRTIDAVIKIGKAAIYFTRGIGQTFEEQQANACLIASAPDLLAILNEVCKQHDMGLNKIETSLYDIAKIAIRKAKGEA